MLLTFKKKDEPFYRLISVYFTCTACIFIGCIIGLKDYGHWPFMPRQLQKMSRFRAMTPMQKLPCQIFRATTVSVSMLAMVYTSPHRLKEEFRCSEGESKEPKPSHLDKFDSGDGRGEDRNRVLERPHFSSTVKDRDRYRHYREYRERSRSRYGHSYRESHPFRERSTSRDRHHRDHWDRFSHHRRERHHSQRTPREEHNQSRDRRFVSDSYRSSGHHNRDGYSSHSHRGVDGGYGRMSHTVNGSKVRPASPHSVSPLPGYYKRKRSPSADARQSSDECRAKKKRNKEKHRRVIFY